MLREREREREEPAAGLAEVDGNGFVPAWDAKKWERINKSKGRPMAL